MSEKICTEELYLSKDGDCCGWCEAGTYKEKDCDGATETQCKPCRADSFMATRNHKDKCLVCKTCSMYNNQKTLRECTRQEDAVCECVSGFYCNNSDCAHCLRVTLCPAGHGVTTKASRMTNAICSPCESATFSNVSDHHSPCRPHTRCEDIGRELDTPGNETADAVCGAFKTTACPWMLPAGLWLGLVLTAALVFAVALCCWRSKRRRQYTQVTLCGAEAASDATPAADELKLPLPSKETHTPSYAPDPPVYPSGESTDEMQISCDGLDLENTSVPITPFKVSVSFLESPVLTPSSRFCTDNYQRTVSEPQEDEWCGT